MGPLLDDYDCGRSVWAPPYSSTYETQEPIKGSNRQMISEKTGTDSAESQKKEIAGSVEENEQKVSKS